MNSQSLGSIIKSARDLMRKDAGLNTDVDRIPQLAWMLFLKCFDDFEKKRSALDKNYREAIPAPYRWRDWAADENKGKTGPDLLKFVNDDLFPTLGKLTGGKGYEQRDVIASIFKELNNRLLSGYILRDVANIINKVNFVSTDDIHTMARLYESMLLEMRNAAGDHGEFYTPRPVIRFMIQMIKPNLKKGEKILDPAAGTGGFLVECLEYMKKDEKSKADYQKLRYNTLFGIEKKPMPYLLGMMNMLLHDIDRPNIIRRNTLAKPLKEIIEEDQYDVIVTNPPFGGEEEEGMSSNLPSGMQTSDTALAFMLFIMESLKQKGRCAIILPNGPLFASGIGQKIKQKLLEEFNLHTIIRMPRSVFAPYTPIATNILFFEKTGPTKEIWYYDLPKREGYKSYNKTNPLKYEAFLPVIDWWNKRIENERTWKVTIEEIRNQNYNLDLTDPKSKKKETFREPELIIKDIFSNETEVIKIITQIKEKLKEDVR